MAKLSGRVELRGLPAGLPPGSYRGSVRFVSAEISQIGSLTLVYEYVHPDNEADCPVPNCPYCLMNERNRKGFGYLVRTGHPGSTPAVLYATRSRLRSLLSGLAGHFRHLS